MPTLDQELASLPFIDVPILGTPGPYRLAGYDTVRLTAFAAIAGWVAVGGPEPPPEWKTAFNRVVRKSVWRELHSRNRRRHPLDQWENWHHPL